MHLINNKQRYCLKEIHHLGDRQHSCSQDAISGYNLCPPARIDCHITNTSWNDKVPLWTAPEGLQEMTRESTKGSCLFQNEGRWATSLPYPDTSEIQEASRRGLKPGSPTQRLGFKLMHFPQIRAPAFTHRSPVLLICTAHKTCFVTLFLIHSGVNISQIFLNFGYCLFKISCKLWSDYPTNRAK